MKKVAIITNIIPEYRRGFISKISKLQEIKCVFFCQKELKGINHTILSANDFPEVIRYIPYTSLGKNSLTWQFLPFFELLSKFDVLIFTGNPRVISSVFFSLIARIFRKKIIVWGHVRTAGSDGLFKRMRLLWWSIFQIALTYTEKESIELKGMGFKGKAISINNGVDYHSINDNFLDIGLKIDPLKRIEFPRLIMCCRLIEKNKIDEFIDAVSKIKLQFGNLKCDIVGDGPLRLFLQEKVDQLKLGDMILFHGPIYDETKLAHLFNSSMFLVHPGAIGLSALHSLCYSVPIITHNDELMHMPEFSVLNNYENSILYNSNESLESVLKKVLSIDKKKYMKLVSSSSEQVKKYHNSKVMVERLLESVQ